MQRVKVAYSADGSDTHVTADANGLKVQGLVSLASSTVNASQAGSFNVTQGTSPWLVSSGGSLVVGNTVNVSQAGSFAVAPGTTVNVNVASQTFSGTQFASLVGSVNVVQGTSPWLVSVGGSLVVGNTVNVSQAGSFSVTQGTNPWNDNVASYGGAATSLGQKTGAASVPVVLPSDQTVNTNLASVSASVTVTANQGTSAATSNAWPIKPIRDIGRTPLTFWVDDVAGISTEALATMNITKAGLSQATSTSYIVTAGKILRLCGFVMSTRASVASIQAARARVRQGNAATHSVLLSLQASPLAATINAVGTNEADLAEGTIELPASTSLCISHVETAVASNTFSCCLVGYEYTP